MFYSQVLNPNKDRINSMYQDSNDTLIKARILLPVGSKATWGGIDYEKTLNGWIPVKKDGETKSKFFPVTLSETKFQNYGKDPISDDEIGDELGFKNEYWRNYAGQHFTDAGALIIKIKKAIEAIKTGNTSELKRAVKHVGARPLLKEVSVHSETGLRNMLQLTYFKLLVGSLKPVIAEGIVKKAKEHLEKYKEEVESEIVKHQHEKFLWLNTGNNNVVLSIKPMNY